MDSETRYKMMENYFSTYPFHETTLKERIERLIEGGELKEAFENEIMGASIKEIVEEVIDEWKEIKKNDVSESKEFSRKIENDVIRKLREFIKDYKWWGGGK